MKPFMDGDFLLSTQTARTLFHEYAESMPIVDYHCHLDPWEIVSDRKFENITQLWLGGDHYKWRQMRSNGVPEEEITGSAPDRVKFQRWAQTLEMAIGNPLYHWSHLELRRYFGYTGCLNGDTAQEVWDLCNEKLQEDSMSVRNILRRSGVTLLCTTDDPEDDLKAHEQIARDDSCETQVLPAWRPDRAIGIGKPDYPDYIGKLSAASGVEIDSFRKLKEALGTRMDYFQERGCRVSDHGVDYVVFAPADEDEVERIFSKRLKGEELLPAESRVFQHAVMMFLGEEYSRRGWVMQLHYGCKRNNNSRMYRQLGPDTGFDCVNNEASASQLSDFLNCMDEKGALPKTIIYSLNPGDDAAVGTIIGCFQDGSVPGKIQQGAAWWFNDHKTGIQAQMTSLANLGLLGNFIGMLTDSRSFLSYTRHEYFRRILCDLIGGWVENGEYPADWKALEKIIRGISYNNAVRYFGFDVPAVEGGKR